MYVHTKIPVLSVGRSVAVSKEGVTRDTKKKEKKKQTPEVAAGGRKKPHPRSPFTEECLGRPDAPSSAGRRRLPHLQPLSTRTGDEPE